jgi:hypothetical protein
VNVNNRTIIPLCCIASSNNDNNKCEGRTSTTPTQQSKKICCPLQDATTTMLRNMTTSGACTLRLSTASTPKTACKYAKDGVYFVKGEYGKNAEEDAFVKEGDIEHFVKDSNDEPLAKKGNWAGCNNEPLATRAIGHFLCARQ